MYVCTVPAQAEFKYGVATISRMLKNICLFAEYRSLLWGSFAKETYIYTHSLIEHNESNDMNVPLDIGTHQFFGCVYLMNVCICLLSLRMTFAVIVRVQLLLLCMLLLLCLVKSRIHLLLWGGYHS